MKTVAKPRETRRERERQLHEQEILDAAERVFCRDGFFGASIQTIAVEAEFSVGTLYNFFRGKEAIYERMMERKAQDVVAYYRRAGDGDWGPRETVRRLLAAKASYFSANRDFFRMYVTEICGGSTCNASVNLSKVARETYAQHLEWLASVFAEGTEAGEFVDLEPMHLTLYLESLGNAFLTMYLEDESGKSLERNLMGMTKIFFDGVSAGGSAGGKGSR
jgi:AcrR family transcriptional regulator